MATTSWNKPFTEFIYNTETDKFSASPFNAPPVYPDEYKDLVAEEVDVKGHDGVMVPQNHRKHFALVDLRIGRGIFFTHSQKKA